MPTYIYQCADGHTLERSHSIHLQPDIDCPNCGKAMNRVPQSATIKFYGTGWASKGD